MVNKYLLKVSVPMHSAEVKRWHDIAEEFTKVQGTLLARLMPPPSKLPNHETPAGQHWRWAFWGTPAEPIVTKIDVIKTAQNDGWAFALELHCTEGKPDKALMAYQKAQPSVGVSLGTISEDMPKSPIHKSVNFVVPNPPAPTSSWGAKNLTASSVKSAYENAVSSDPRKWPWIQKMVEVT